MKFRDRSKSSSRKRSQIKRRGDTFRENGIRIPVSIFFFLLLFFQNGVTSEATGLVEDLYVTNGTVYTIAENDTTVFIGGDFTVISRKTGSMVELNPFSSVRNSVFPVVIGSVNVMISDGEEPNGWYIAGEFTSIGGNSIYNIAHINPDGTVDTAFNPTGGYLVDGAIHTMVLHGDILYVGGEFEDFLGLGQVGLVAIDTESLGINTVWKPAPSGGSVKTAIYSMVLSGTTLYVAGDFSSIGGETRAGLAALETIDEGDKTGRANSTWNPNPQGGNVKTMLVSGSTLYVGGTFTSIGDQTRSRITVVDMVGSGDGTGRADATWNPNVTGNSVDTLLLSGSTLYVGGNFTSISGRARNNLAAIDALGAGDGTGRADLTWNPNVDATTVSTMALDNTNHRLFIGGEFTQVGGQTRNHIAVVDAVGGGDGSGDVLSWDANANLPVMAVALSSDGSKLYAGGWFNSLVPADEYKNRNRIAAIDKSNGEPTDWNPDANGRVRSLVLSGNTLYAGGLFTQIGGLSRNRIAALNITLNANNATSWNPDANGGVNTLLLDGETLYVGGAFTQIGGSARNRIAGLDTGINTNNATSWNPDANDDVYAMLLKENTLFVGGAFTQIGGSARNNIAALATTTNTNNATTWNPSVSIASGQSAVYALARSNTTLYVGGLFNTIGGSSRNNIAALNTTVNTGNATSWNPNIDNAVYTMTLSGSSLYIGGNFAFIGGNGINDSSDVGGIDAGIPHLGVAVLDIARDWSIARTWNPVLYNGLSTAGVYALSVTQNTNGMTFYVGGNFSRMGDSVGGNLSRFNFTSPQASVIIKSGTYPKEQFVAITCKPADGFECDSAYYTLDGSEPTAYSTVVEWGGAYIENSATLKYFVMDNAGTASAVGTEKYVIEFKNVICFINIAEEKSVIYWAFDFIKRWIK